MEKDELKEKLDAGKEKAKAGAGKVNEKIKGLAFRGMLEKRVSPETRAKFPILDKIIPLTNYIACGLVVLLVVMVVSCGGRGGGSSGGGSSGSGRAAPATDFSYTLTEDGNGVLIIEYTGSRGGPVVIPASIEGIPVREIGEYAFRGAYGSNTTEQQRRDRDRITQIVVPNGVTHIHFGAFTRIENLVSISLPNSVQFIANGAFALNPKLTTINLPQNAELVIYSNAFANLPELTDLSIPNNFTAKFRESRSQDEITERPRRDDYSFDESAKLPLRTRQQLREMGFPRIP